MKNFLTHLNKIIILILLAMSVNCGDSNQEIVMKDLNFKFKAEINEQSLDFNSGRYMTEAGNEISIDRIKIYFSNLELINTANQNSFQETDSYHLISLNADKPSDDFTLNNIPEGFTFNQIKFSIGVDPDKNFSLDNTGDLDPANDMAWNWDTGYKFFLLEGSYYPPAVSENKGLIIHIGHDKNYRTIEINFNKEVTINELVDVEISLDALAPFNGPNVIDLTNNSSFKGQVDSDVIADNYSTNLISSFIYNIE